MTAGGFRPLTGIKVSERNNYGIYVRNERVSVPSRGLRYLNNLVVNGRIYTLGFRPLTGIKVSEQIVNL